mmetsp:Transcript_30213/g.56439  ORF Transcript_30213/g.56439 Transcript_30213/m.56439 type:complete len:162 (-) Transcript_30213:170-655(-)
MGPKFSYSVYCRNYVQLSTSKIEVLVCKESEEPFDTSGRGVDCDTPGFSVSINDTIAPSEATLPDDMRVVLREQLPGKQGEKLIKMLKQANFQESNIAESLRNKVEAEYGGMWNIIVEEEKTANVQGFYYDYRRQLSVETMDFRWVLFAFDRRCRTRSLFG